MNRIRFCILWVLVALATSAVATAQPKFYRDDPLESEPRVDVPVEPAEVKLSDLYDRLRHTFEDREAAELNEVQNVNTLDEVPDNEWFTNRHGLTRTSLEALARGPNRSDGPSADGLWVVVEGKSEGLTPGFEIVDVTGTRYVIKLDPVDIPELSTAAEVIATKLFYAFGYNVPENTLVWFDPESLVIRDGAQFFDRFGKPMKLTKARLGRMLRHVPRRPDGTLRATASKYLEGESLGPFRYYGTRSDDPNDVVPHEDRRELRGLRLFAAWLNHDDARAQNTLDVWVEDNGRRTVRHHLIDFGSTFGSGTIDLQLPNLSFHYWWDADLIKKNALGFGSHVPEYRKVEWPNFSDYPSVGRWESTYFDPADWKTDYPNPAFVRMTARDAFWAAKIVMRFTRAELDAIVATGEFSRSEEAAYFLETLIERQQKVGRYGLNGVNPLDGFRVADGRLEFSNLSETYGFATRDTTYRITWSAYDNATGSARVLSGPVQLARTSAALPRATSARRGDSPSPGTVAFVGGARMSVRSYGVDGESVLMTTADGAARANESQSGAAVSLPSGELLLAEIYSDHHDYPAWNSRIGVYLRSSGSGGYDVVGIERERGVDAHMDEVSVE